MTVKDIILAYPIIVNDIAPEDYDAVTTFKIARLIKEIEQIVDSFNNTRSKIGLKYAVKDENGNPIITDGSIQIEGDCVEKCNAELDTLLNMKIDINAEKIPITSLKNISPQKAMNLLPFVE